MRAFQANLEVVIAARIAYDSNARAVRRSVQVSIANSASTRLGALPVVHRSVSTKGR